MCHSLPALFVAAGAPSRLAWHGMTGFGWDLEGFRRRSPERDAIASHMHIVRHAFGKHLERRV